MKSFVEKLIKDGTLKTPAIIEAFKKITRAEFLPPDVVDQKNFDVPLPIGRDQTISQPFTVALMLEELQPQAGEKILDVGSGSGWSTALLAEIVGPQGKVFAIERIKELKEFGEKNVAKFNFKNVKFTYGDGSKGLPSEAPFDKIMASAAAYKIPEELKKQLAVGGKMIIPTAVAQDLRAIVRVSETKFKEKIYEGFLFVPLVLGDLE